VSNVLIDPIFDHAEALELGISIFFCCCVLICCSEVHPKVVPECFFSRAMGRWDSIGWISQYCASKLIDLFFDPIVHFRPSDE